MISQKMCDPQHFDFVDLNLDFLDITSPAPTQGAPQATKCDIPRIKPELDQQINKTGLSTKFRQSSKLQDLAKRIASTDLCVQQINSLQEERSALQQQLQELQSSANDVRRLYDEENQERKRLKFLSDKLTANCDSLRKELANKTLSCDQLESKLEYIKNVPIDYNELVVCFLKLCSSYDEEVKPLHKPQLDLVDKLKNYCKEHSLKTPYMMKRSPKKRINKPPKAEAGIQCELWKMAPMSTASAANVPKEMRSQGTQHISTTTTRSTCTSTFIKKHNVGTSFPEPSLLPPVNDIVVEMLKWDIRPLSPICEFIPDTRTEDQKIKKSTGTCTKLCNIQRSIDYIGVSQSLLSSIKRSNSRPPSRTMFDNFKHELLTPPPTTPPITPYATNNFPHIGSMNSALSAATFEDLWQVFGQMLFGLLGNRPDGWSSAARSGNGQSQQEFYHWLRSLYADISEHQQQQQQEPQQQQETCINSSIPHEGLNPIAQNIGNSQFMFLGRNEMYLTPTQGYVDNSQHTSIATSPIRSSSPNAGDICKVVIPSQASSEIQNVNLPEPLARSERSSQNGSNDDNKELGRKNIVNEILKLFPSTESTQETKKKLSKVLKTKRKRKCKRQLNKNQKADDVKENSNTFDSLTAAKMECSSNFESELRQYSQSSSAISPIKDRMPEEIQQQNEMNDNNFVYSATKSEQVHAESELRVDTRNVGILSCIKNDAIENKEDGIKLEYNKNCLVSPDELPQNQTNKFWLADQNSEHHENFTKETYEEISFASSAVNETIEYRAFNSCTEDNNIQNYYEDSNYSNQSLNEVAQTQVHDRLNGNEETSDMCTAQENIEHTENDIKNDNEETAFSFHSFNEVSQNQAPALWNSNERSSVTSRREEERFEHTADDVKDDYEKTSFIPPVENEAPHNETNKFWNKNFKTSIISCIEEEIVNQSELHIKDDYEEHGFTPSFDNEVTQNELWNNNERTPVPFCENHENTEHIADNTRESYAESASLPTLSNAVDKNQANELKMENEAAFLLPSSSENAVDFLSQLQLSSYSVAANETLVPIMYESPQSPTGSSFTNQEYCENSMVNKEKFLSQSEHVADDLAQNNNCKNSSTTCLMSTLFGSVTDSDSDSDNDIKDEFSAEDYKIQMQNEHTNQTAVVINSTTFDYKINDIEVENLSESQPEEKLDVPFLIKDEVSKCSLAKAALNEVDTHHKSMEEEEEIMAEDLPYIKIPKIQEPLSPIPQTNSPPHISANESHKNELSQCKSLQNQINTNARPTSILKSMDSASKKHQNIERNDIKVAFIKQYNSAVIQAHEKELENVRPCLVVKQEPDVKVSSEYLEDKMYECSNLVIDEDYCNTSLEYSQDNDSITDSTQSTNDAEEKVTDNSNIKIEEVHNHNSTQSETQSPSKLQTSPAKGIHKIKVEVDTVTNTTSNNNIDDDNFNNYLSNILQHVAPRNISPISFISNSVSSAAPIKTDDITLKPEPKKRGRKRKNSVCPNAAPTAAIACKRSARLSIKKSVDETKLDKNHAPLHSLATIKIGKYAPKSAENDDDDDDEKSLALLKREEDDEKSRRILDRTLTIDDEKTSTVVTNLDYFSERRSTAMCGPLAEKTTKDIANTTQSVRQFAPISADIKSSDNQRICYQDIFQSFAEQHRKSLPKKKFESWPTISPIQQTLNYEILKPNVSFNCDIAKDEATIDHDAEQQYKSPASPHIHTTLDSPASPSADLFETSDKHKETKEIPLEPDRTRYEVQRNSLLQRLIANHSSSIHQLVTDTFNKKYSNSIQTKLCLRIKNFLTDTEDTNPESAAIQLVQDLFVITLNIKHITAAIVAEMQAVPRPEIELACAVADVPAKYLGKQHRRISFAMRRLQQLQPNFTTELMGHIESTLFNYCTVENLSLAATLNLTQLYLLTLSICMPDMQKNPARLFIAKCLYYYNLKAIPMIYEVLCCFPTTLPHREERRYDRTDALINVIQHLLMSTKYDMDKHDLCTKQLLSKLRFEYHFEPFQPERTEVLTNLVEKIKADKLENVSYALALFCKRLHQPKVESDVLEAKLMPLANEFYQIVTHSDSHDSRIACLLECISMVIKPFRMDTNIAIYMSIFSRFLNIVTRAIPQEAAVRAIIRCQRFGYVNCYNELLNFKPCYDLQPITKAMLETFVYRKSAKFWRSLNTSAVSLTF